MKPWERKIVPAGLAAASLVFLVAAFKPAFVAGSLDVTFLLVGLACAVLAVLAWRNSGAPSGR